MSRSPQRAAFVTTRWSLVLAARSFEDTQSRQALAELFEAYAYPLYAFARRWGLDREDAHDAVQGFFARLLESHGLRTAQRGQGRFRSYLLGALKHFLANERARQNAAKRGGGEALVALDLILAEKRYDAEPAEDETPERLFERRWALTVIDRTLSRLSDEARRGDREAAFEEMRVFLTGEAARGGYAEIAGHLGISEGAVRVAVHRLRRRFAALLRDEVAATVDGQDRLEPEIRYLLDVVGR